MRFVAGFAALLVALTACSSTPATPDDVRASHQAAIRANGSAAMPFDLDATAHDFTPTESGGTQVVVVRDAADVASRTLIRAHLAEIAASFAVGNFEDPTAVHGREMPGLATLQARAADLTITYSDVPNGGAITYTASDPELVTAIHTWFDAQLNDHGADATTGMGAGMSTSDMEDNGMTAKMICAHHPGSCASKP